MDRHWVTQSQKDYVHRTLSKLHAPEGGVQLISVFAPTTIQIGEVGVGVLKILGWSLVG